MSDSQENGSVLLLGFGGRIIATRELALMMAGVLIRDVYGEQELDLQKPLGLSDGGDRWVIEGSGEFDMSTLPGCVSHGRVEMEIAKANCRVLKLSRTGMPSTPRGSAPKTTQD
jgi:hypothetical protein